MSGILDDLRIVGNRAAHDNSMDLTKDDAMRYRDLAKQVVSHLAWEEVKGLMGPMGGKIRD
jgi:hypothetical protein